MLGTRIRSRALLGLGLGFCVQTACAEPAPATVQTAAQVVSRETGKQAPAERPASPGPRATPTKAEPAHPEVEAVQAKPTRPPSVSLGYPNDGTLQHAATLPLETPALRFNPNRESTARFATDQVIAAITRAADVVHREMPGGRLTVNDLSLKEGGPIAHHGSHRNGRDADILFYLLDDTGRPMESVGAPLDPEGNGHDYKDLSIAKDDVPVHLDTRRTWRFVQALIQDPVAQIQRIFVVEHVRSALLAEAERKGAPRAVRERFGHVACQPGFPHDDHMHVRWFCDPGDIDEGCQEMAPIYPWHRDWLAERNLKPVPAVRHRKPPKAEIVSHAQARKQAKRRAGRIHPKVRAFLERRKTWLPAPHPGRRWCR